MLSMRQTTNNRDSVALLIIGSPLRAQAPLTIPKLSGSYSGRSYLPVP